MLPYLKSVKNKTQKQIVTFRGINYSDMYQDGDLREAKNISSRRFPYLTTRRARAKQDYSDVTAMTVWDELITVRGGNIYKGGEPLADEAGNAYEISEGEKQFAVLNTKLVIWPDKAYVDLTDGTFGRLEATAETKKAVVTTNSIQCDLYKLIQANKKHRFSNVYISGKTGAWTPALYTYGVEKDKIGWNAETKEWSLPDAELKCLAKYSGYPDLEILQQGDIIMLASGRYPVYADYKEGKLPDTMTHNEDGYFGVVTKVEEDYQTNDGAFLNVYYDIYVAGQQNLLFSSSFRVGDRVDIAGTLYGYNDKEKAEIVAIDDTTNTLTFPDDTFKFYTLHATVTADMGAGKYKMNNGSTSLCFTTDTIIKAGATLLGDANTITVWDEEKKVVVDYYSVEATNAPQGYATIASNKFSEEKKELTIKRQLPDLDYICESNNRLFGCSNADKTIYASELGDPTRFYSDATFANGAYAVPVGTEGKFTGCCKYGSSVLFWKEKHLHKLLGTSPLDYALYEYELEGVQDGSYKSLQSVNNVVYYLGANGVYAYTGGVPSLVSDAFGQRRFKNGVAGNDGDTYYLSAWEDDACSLFAYETKRGFWYREDETNVVDFARMGKDIYMLDDKGDVWLMDSGAEDTEMSWEVQFTPFYETLQGRKTYSKILLRMELPKGSWVKAWTRSDGRRWVYNGNMVGEDKYPEGWRPSGSVVGKDYNTTTMLIPVNRCDKFEIKLTGKGQCTILSMLREFSVGSEV